MVGIPDYSQMPVMSEEEYAAREAEIDAEIEARRAARLQTASDELNAVPSYVEQQACNFVLECNRLGIASLPG